MSNLSPVRSLLHSHPRYQWACTRGSIYPQTSERVGTLTKHVLQVHRRHQEENVGPGFEKFFSEYLKEHNIKCKQEKFTIICQYCEEEFDSNQGKNLQ